MYYPFPDNAIVVCPECWARPDGAEMELEAGKTIPAFPEDPDFMVYMEPDRVTGFVFHPCGHRFGRLTYVMQETPVGWGIGRPEIISVWFVDGYLKVNR